MMRTVTRTMMLAMLCTLVGCATRHRTAQAPDLTAPHIDAALQQKLQALLQGFGGDVGVYVQHLRTGQTVAIRADDLFPTASMIKVPILVGVFDAMQRGALRADTTLLYRDSLLYAGDDIAGKLRDSVPMPLTEVAMLMITTSDNTAALWLQGLVGGSSINDWLAAHGFDSTRVNSRTPGREANRTAMGWGQTTPREMATLVAGIRRGTVVSRGASEELYRYLTRIYWNAEALSQIPPWVQAASKQGAVDRSRSEVVLVNAPGGDYVFCIITKNATDQRYSADNEGYVLIRRLSALLWREFEPRHPFTPDSAAVRFKPGAD